MGSWLRKKALAETMVHIHYEDENTRYVDIGPVNKVLNMMCCWFENPESEAFKRHLPRLHDYLWVAEDGMKMQGYNGSQLWDTSFAVQAIASTGLSHEFVDCLKKAGGYIENTQVIEEAQAPLSRYYRHISKGAWPFSTRDHGWPISDCTSEGLKAAMALKELEGVVGWKPLPLDRLNDCLDVILSYQNGDGGFATYENMRSFGFLELINPSETFGDIVVDYNYVECTSACVTAMTAFAKNYPRASRWRDPARHLQGDEVRQIDPEGRRIVVRKLGRLLHVRHLVRPDRSVGGGRDVQKQLPRAQGMRVFGIQAGGRRRMG